MSRSKQTRFGFSCLALAAAAVIGLGVIGPAQAQHHVPPKFVPNGYRPQMYMPYMPNHHMQPMPMPHGHVPDMHHRHHEMPFKHDPHKKHDLDKPAAKAEKPGKVVVVNPAKTPTAEAMRAAKKALAANTIESPKADAKLGAKKAPVGHPAKLPAPAAKKTPFGDAFKLPVPDINKGAGRIWMPERHGDGLAFDNRFAESLDALFLDLWTALFGEWEE